jgi:hypothetical protein
MKKMMNVFLFLLSLGILTAFIPHTNLSSQNGLKTSMGDSNDVILSAETTPDSLPLITLKPGGFYLNLEGKENFLFSRNIAGNETQQYSQLLDITHSGGSRLVRIQLDSFGTGITQEGEVDKSWVSKWEQVLDEASAQDIYVMLTFSSWYDWNNGKPFYGYSNWKANAFNSDNGGPTATPDELFKSGSVTQTRWLVWIKKLVNLWQDRRNIAAWEIFSEANLASGASQTAATSLIEKAEDIIRKADSYHRPITASLADMGEWSAFLRSPAIDFINIHPYPPDGKLDRKILADVPGYLAKYKKPVMIGESGLSALTPDNYPPTLTTAKNAEIGIRHAIWAGLVSGSMNGRALWWEDGVAVYFPSLSWSFLNRYADTELPATRLIDDMDFSGFKPLKTISTPDVIGAAIDNEKSVIGWFRDAKCEPPDWKLQPVISRQNVTITVPGSAEFWKVDFYKTSSGTEILSSNTAARKGRTITITLPDFKDDIAFKMIPSR